MQYNKSTHLKEIIKLGRGRGQVDLMCKHLGVVLQDKQDVGTQRAVQ